MDLINAGPMKDLFEYLDSQLQVMAEYLYPNLTTMIVKELWETIMNVC